ncbi:DUF1847 domain-containing protein [Anaerosphaera multitolerans]|uniref:DUF1847 domain-containing protein n=2 Tax=Anaerosphaera multitolerans TaxID=2487351 RepID=A0A437S6U6_9FIRM|nr:DUF1847 domain-containing protein [Anaerosphaera multitolerans]
MCKVLACAKGDDLNLPKNCPTEKQNIKSNSFKIYKEYEDFYIKSSEIEADGYGNWVRLKEIGELCIRMSYKKVGIAFCKGLQKEAAIIHSILKNNFQLEVISVICKVGGIDKSEVGISENKKLNPEEFEAMCNPIGQAEYLNKMGTEFNIVVGLCVGHDSLFYKHSNALVTTLIAKDRVLAHNPVGAVYGADKYFKNKLLSENVDGED